MIERDSLGMPERIVVVPLRHTGRWLTAAVVTLFIAWVIYLFASSPNIDYRVVARFQFAGAILSGLELTIVYAILAEAIGIVLGIVAALMRLSANPVLVAINLGYTWLFRGVPILVQILLWYNIALVLPTLGIHIPFTSVGFSVSTNSVVTPFVAGVVALSLNEGAYMAEIVRGGISSIDPGQAEAAQTVGLTPLQCMRHVIMPQALRVIIPPTGNDFISMLKTTSLVSVISGAELLTQAERIYSTNFRTVELLFVASVWYLVLTTIATVGQYYLERHFARGSRNSGSSGLRKAVLGNLRVGRVGDR